MTNPTENIALLNIYASTNMGKIRKNNEDAMFAEGIGIGIGENLLSASKLFDDEIRLFAVCDGMGGEEFGEEASKIAVTTLQSYLPVIKESPNIIDPVNNFVKNANDRIVNMAEAKGCTRSGSTLSMVCIYKGMVYPFNVGDSRVYFYSDSGEFRQVTIDQTLAMKKLINNIYDEETARNSPDSHKLTSYLGVDTKGIGLTATPTTPFPMGNGKILICSDGLTDMCSDEEIKSILFSSVSPASDLIDKALQNGGKDNVTCVVISRDTSVRPAANPKNTSPKAVIPIVISVVLATILLIIGIIWFASKNKDKDENDNTSSKKQPSVSQSSEAKTPPDDKKAEPGQENDNSSNDDNKEEAPDGDQPFFTDPIEGILR